MEATVIAVVRELPRTTGIWSREGEHMRHRYSCPLWSLYVTLSR